MQKSIPTGIVIIFAVAFAPVASGQGITPYSDAGKQTEVTIETADGVSLFADLLETTRGRDAPIVLLFHQAGSSARGEYRTIAPRLINEGYHVLATDQRSGGDQFVLANRTVRAIGKNASYCEAYPDLEAALSFAKDQGFGGPIFVWGSSYSAGLVINLGVDHPEEITAILSFSTAASGPMEPCSSNQIVDQLNVPMLALRPRSEMSRQGAIDQQEHFQQLGFETHVSENGVHGSSMLSPWRIDGDPEPTWEVVLDFLKRNGGDD